MPRVSAKKIFNRISLNDMKRNLIYFLMVVGMIIPTAINAKVASKANCVILAPTVNQPHKDLPAKIVDKLADNGINAVLIDALSLSDMATRQEVSDYITGKVDSLKKANHLPTGILSFGPANSVAAMDAAANGGLAFLGLHSALGTDGKDFISDKLCEPSYYMVGGKEATDMRKKIRSAIEGVASPNDVDKSLPIANVLNDKNVKRLMTYDVEKAVGAIKCPVVLSYGLYDGVISWNPNLSNLEKCLQKNNKDYSTLKMPVIDHYLRKAESMLPSFVSVSYSPDYVPQYDLGIVDSLSEAILGMIN